MPNIWINRDISKTISSNRDAIQVVRGPRQCGKTIFIDTDLACRLQGWTQAQPIMTSPQQGQLFENLVFSEVYKTTMNLQAGWSIYHWRSRDGEEVDFLLQKNPQEFIFIEAKTSRQNIKDISTLPEVRKVFKDKTPPLLLCHQEGKHLLDKKVPIAFLKQVLVQAGT